MYLKIKANYPISRRGSNIKKLQRDFKKGKCYGKYAQESIDYSQINNRFKSYRFVPLCFYDDDGRTQKRKKRNKHGPSVNTKRYANIPAVAALVGHACEDFQYRRIVKC